MARTCLMDETKRCVECGECTLCDLNPQKLCDNCMTCVKKFDADYAAIEIDELILGEADVQQD